MTAPDAAGPPPTLAARLRAARAALRDTREVFALTPRALRLVWRAHPGYATAAIASSVVNGFQPLADAWVAKLVIDAIAAAVLGLPDPWAAAPQLLALMVVRAAMALWFAGLVAPDRLAWQQLGDHLSRDVQTAILRKANSLKDISFFEGPAFFDLLMKAQGDAGYRPLQLVNNLTNIVRSALSLLTMSAVLLAFSPPVALLVIALTLPNVYALFRQGKENWRINDWAVPEVRRMHYFRRLLTDKAEAKEVRIFGLGGFFLDEHHRAFDTFHRRFSAMRVRHWRWNSALGLLAAAGSATAYAFITLSALSGRITLGDLLLFNAALSSVTGTLSQLTWNISGLHSNNLFIGNLFTFLDLPPAMPEPPPGTKPPAPEPMRRGVELRNVAFGYAGSDSPVLQDVSLTIAPGQTLALVGENGAGKTTLVKLLARLYDPTSGQILVDGKDLREYDLDSWRRQLGVVLQDFTRYNLVARENIGVGDVTRVEDVAAVQVAAARGGADAVVERLVDGYETMLGRRFAVAGNDGVDLSGGEWQKVALSRAFMRDQPNGDTATPALAALGPALLGPAAPALVLPLLPPGDRARAQLLILDEPTAALDARAEHELFLRFRELTKDKATLLISHRFSTVRMADVIAVLEHGRIVEQGGHDALLARGGTYARLYAMQAERYQ